MINGYNKESSNKKDNNNKSRSSVRLKENNNIFEIREIIDPPNNKKAFANLENDSEKVWGSILEISLICLLLDS